MSLNKFLDEACALYDLKKHQNLSGFDIYQCEDEVINSWINSKRYNDLIRYACENFNTGQWHNHLTLIEKEFIENKLEKEFIKLWKNVLRFRFETLWEWNKDFGKKTKYWDATEKTYEAQKFTLEGLYKFKDGLVTFNSLEEIENVNKLIISVENLKKPKPKPTIDKRKIDENVFWELIEVSRKKSENKYEFIEVLSNELENFKASEIRKFEKFFLIKFEELNRKELWALAYIFLRGCGDDCFDYFKCWVISKGYETYENIKNLNTEKLNILFDEEPQLEDLFYVSEKVYESKTGELMQPVKVKKQKLIGKNWREDNLENEFPELCKIFNYKHN